jgi:RsmE family RNA methyltransferase
MNICLFSKDEIECPKPCLSFDDKRGEHILKVLHKETGDSFTAGVIDGQSGDAVITGLDEAARKIFFEFEPTGDGKPLNPLKMIVGFVRPIQLRRLLRDVAALGVSELHLTGTELGEKSYMQSDLAQPDKVRELLLEGTVQAGSTHVPQVFIHKSVQDCLVRMGSQECMGSQERMGSLRLSKGPLLICLDNVNPKCSLSEAISGVPALQQAQEPSDNDKMFYYKKIE